MFTENFYMSLEIMGIGMLGIFFFMVIFWAVIVLLHKFFPGDAPVK